MLTRRSPLLPLLVATSVALLTGCATAPPAAPEPPPAAVVEIEVDELPKEPIGMVRVTASKLNVRKEATTRSDVVAAARRGERLSLLARAGEWSLVRLSSGAEGWAASRYLRDDRCLPDREFQLLDAPPLTFGEDGPRGTVTVEATVNEAGRVVGTKTIANTTGSDELRRSAEQEIRSATFAPPVRNCKPKRFIYVYQRTF